MARNLANSVVTNNPRSLFFNQSQVKISECYKYQGLILDTKLIVKEHLENNINKENRIVASVKTLYLTLPRKFSLTISNLLGHI